MNPIRIDIPSGDAPVNDQPIKCFVIQHRRRPELFLGRDGKIRDFPLTFAAEPDADGVLNALGATACDWEVRPGSIHVGSRKLS